MGRRLLPFNIGANTTGIWVSIQMGRRRSFPIRVIAAGNFQGDNVFIEELVGGIPSNMSIYGSVDINLQTTNPNINNKPIGQTADTGFPKLVGTINPATGGGQTTDLVVDQPTSEYIRARTGAFTSGTVTICEVETLE